MKNSTLIGSLFVMALFIFSGAVFVKTSAWYYGIRVASPYSLYNDVEMPTGGQHIGTGKPADDITYWEAAHTICCYIQEGEWEMGGTAAGLGNATVTCGHLHWCMFFEYFTSVLGDACNTITGCGNMIVQPTGWKNTDRIFFAQTVFPTTGDIGFGFYDSTNGKTDFQGACGVTGLTSLFFSNVEEEMEAVADKNQNAIMWNDSAIFAQVVNSTLAQRGFGTGISVNINAQSGSLTDIYGTNNVQIGFDQGSHYGNGNTLWTGKITAGLEDYTPDVCP